MKLTAIKKAEAVSLDGIKAEFVLGDYDKLIRVILRDTKGNILEIAKDGYSDMVVYVPAPPKKKMVWRLSGKMLNFTIGNEDFTTKSQAETRRDNLAKHDPNSHSLVVQEVEVEDE